MTDRDRDHPSDRRRSRERHPGRQPETAPPGEAVSGFPEPPGRDPGDRSRDPAPHHALGNPVEGPDESEWPDPYDRREDPLEPPPDEGFGDQPHPPSGAGSTSRPHPSEDPEGEPWEGPKRDKVDE
jgi:hypothetical protein